MKTHAMLLAGLLLTSAMAAERKPAQRAADTAMERRMW